MLCSVAADEQDGLLRLQLWREAGFRTRAESEWTKAALSWL